MIEFNHDLEKIIQKNVSSTISSFLSLYNDNLPIFIVI